jgi:hypothetical protein
MAKQKQPVSELLPESFRRPPEPKALPAGTDGEWLRVRLGTDKNGVRGYYLDRLVVVDGEAELEHVHGPNVRDVVLGHLMRQVELTF